MASKGKDKYQPWIVKMLHSYGWRTRANFAGYYAPPNEADLVVYKKHLVIHVECKTGKDGSFTLNEQNQNGSGWRVGQREWAAQSVTDGIPYYLAITYEINKNDSPQKRNTASFFVPYEIAIDTLEKMKYIQNSLPFVVKKGYNKILQKNKIDAFNLWQNYSLIYVKYGVLKMPESLTIT